MKTTISRYLGLSRRKQFLVGIVTVVFALMRLGLVLLPFRTLRHRLEGTTPLPSILRPDWTVAQIRWAVTVVAAALPGAETCLPESLTAYVLLRWSGREAEVRLGITPDETSSIRAHSWVVHREEVVVGDDEDLETYESIGTVLPATT